MFKIDEVFQELWGKLKQENLVRNAPMSQYTSFRAGGSCELLVIPQNREELALVVKTCKAHQVPCFLMGNGSNLLVLDGGFSGVIVTLREAFSNVCICPGNEMKSDGQSFNGSEMKPGGRSFNGSEMKSGGQSLDGSGMEPGGQSFNGSEMKPGGRSFDGSETGMEDRGNKGGGQDKDAPPHYLVMAEAGALLSAVARRCAREGLSGLEFAGGIPGSVGGGLFMNAGAYGGQMKDVVRWAEVMNSQGEIGRVEQEEMELSYRHSRFQREDSIILSVGMSLKPADSHAIALQMDELNRRRSEKQPLQYPSAGSFFKRPEGYFAGKLIQDSGLSGVSVGGARISPLHAGFLINEENATATDIIHLMKLVQNTVRDQFGVELEPEVRIIGEAPSAEQ